MHLQGTARPDRDPQAACEGANITAGTAAAAAKPGAGAGVEAEGVISVAMLMVLGPRAAKRELGFPASCPSRPPRARMTASMTDEAGAAAGRHTAVRAARLAISVNQVWTMPSGGWSNFPMP